MVNAPYGYSPTSFSAWPSLPFTGAAPGTIGPSALRPGAPSPEQLFLADLFLRGGGGAQPAWGASASLQALLVHELLQMLVDYFAQYFTPGQTGRDLGSLGASPNPQRAAPGSWGAGGGGGGGASPSTSPSGSVGTPSGTGTTPVPANLPTGRGTVGDFLQAALAQKGDRYRFGAETNLNDTNPDTFDCSELVQWAAHQAGVTIADGSWNQKAATKPISVEEALRTPGALLFKPGHVAISLGDGRTIEAMGTKWGVVVADARGRFTSGGLIPGMQYG